VTRPAWNVRRALVASLLLHGLLLAGAFALPGRTPPEPVQVYTVRVVAGPGFDAAAEPPVAPGDASALPAVGTPTPAAPVAQAPALRALSRPVPTPQRAVAQPPPPLPTVVQEPAPRPQSAATQAPAPATEPDAVHDPPLAAQPTAQPTAQAVAYSPPVPPADRPRPLPPQPPPSVARPALATEAVAAAMTIPPASPDPGPEDTHTDPAATQRPTAPAGDPQTDATAGGAGGTGDGGAGQGAGAGGAAGGPRLVSVQTLDPGFRMLARVQPRYPEAARRLGRPGTVQVELEVAPDGRVTRIAVADESPGWGFGAAAREAYGHARFSPPRLHGEPVRVRWRRTLHFRP